MNAALSASEIRTLACLVEKKITTPENYPLSLNALTNACNQKSNRNPVAHYDEETVVRALDGLRDKDLLWEKHASAARVPKYDHRFDEALGLTASQLAVLCVLMLRGPQTLGELRGRTGRLYRFADTGEVGDTLNALTSRENGALVLRLPRQAGRKESRFTHLLAGEPQLPTDDVAAPSPEPATVRVHEEERRLTELEQQVNSLRCELDELRRELGDFRAELE